MVMSKKIKLEAGNENPDTDFGKTTQLKVKKESKPFFKFNKKTESAKEEPNTVNDKRKEKRFRAFSKPISVLIGHLADVTEKDAISFAKGLAERNFTSTQNSFFYVFKYNNGFCYEIQEGGAGIGLAKKCIKFLENKINEMKDNLEDTAGDLGPKVYIQTADRIVRFELDKGVPSSLLMPDIDEDFSIPTRDIDLWINFIDGQEISGGKMKSMNPDFFELVIVGGVLMLTSLLLLGIGAILKWQAMSLDDKIYTQYVINNNELPISQLKNISIGENYYLHKLEYNSNSGEWKKTVKKWDENGAGTTSTHPVASIDQKPMVGVPVQGVGQAQAQNAIQNKNPPVEEQQPKPMGQ